MKVERLIATLDAIKTNQVNDDTKILWINEVEGRVTCEIFKSPIDEVAFVTAGYEELTVPEPYSRVYILYLIAMIAFVEGDFDLYNKTYIEYESAFSDYAKYVIRNR